MSFSPPLQLSLSSQASRHCALYWEKSLPVTGPCVRMGNSGSFTEKAVINPNLFVFTKWGDQEVREFLQRGQEELPETFALRKHEFDFLLGTELVDYATSRALFHDIFDLDGNGLVDKFEVMAIVCLTSKIGNKDKINFFFDLFNFNDKGYLFQSELTLMMLALSRGVFKVDQKYLPPNNKVIAMLALEAFLHAKVDKTSIRKPELVNFALGSNQVLSFMESWRGHASQVLLADGEKWRDLSFPCLHTSIAPSDEWLKLGLPPAKFVRWRRRERAGAAQQGYLQLFTHEQSFLKTVDRRVVFGGEGVLGRGSLRQGMLADRWVINALAAMTARPDTVLGLLSSTGQEERGRFCTRIYEGGGWRTVNIDDRVPVSSAGEPLFLTSSHSLEAWPLLVEKGLAKYLGSYGHIGSCGSRPDASEKALQMLTGAHVCKIPIGRFCWRSVEAEVRGESGAAFVKMHLAQGAIVALGCSEARSLMQREGPILGLETKVQPIVPPYGRLFPVVGMTIVKGFNYLILRDAYDLISDCDVGVNYESGKCRTFKIRVEDLPAQYDTLVLGRFPDSLRDKAERLHITPWRTELVMQDTGGPALPAKFLLTVAKSSTSGVRLNPLRKLGSRAANITAVLSESDGKVESELARVMTLREKTDFSRVRLNKDAYLAAQQDAKAAADRNAGGAGGAGVGDVNAEGVAEGEGGTGEGGEGEGEFGAAVEKKVRAKLQSGLGGGNDSDSSDLVDVALSISSSCDWTYAGSEAAQARLRVRLCPTAATLVKLKQRDLQAVLVNRQIAKITENRRVAALKAEMEELAASSGALQTGDGGLTDAGAGAGAGGDGADKRVKFGPESEGPQVDAKVEKGEEFLGNMDASKYDVYITAERSWVSQSLLLFPGDWYVFADVSFAVPYETAFNLTLPKDMGEAPWLDGKNPANAEKKDSMKSFTRRSSTAAGPGPAISPDKKKPESSNLVIPASVSLGPEGVGETDADLSLLPRVWLHCSSLESFQVKPISKSDLPVSVNTSLAAMVVPPEVWPFAAESQQDASSRYLLNMLTRAKSDAQLVGLRFLHIANDFKDDRKKRIHDQAEKS